MDISPFSMTAFPLLLFRLMAAAISAFFLKCAVMYVGIALILPGQLGKDCRIFALMNAAVVLLCGAKRADR